MPSTLLVQFLDGPDGTRIAYAAHGQGALLICPAWWVSHLEEDWKYDRFREFFEELAQHFTVVRYDRPGVGLSDGEREEPTLESEEAVLEAVVDRLSEQTGQERASLFAVSCAGPPSLSYTAKHPGKVDRLVLYGTYAIGADLASPEVKDAFCSLVEAHWGLGSQALANIFNPDMSGPELRGFGRRQRVAADAPTACNLLRLTYEMDASRHVPNIDCPALVIHRRSDRAIPFESGRKLAAALPRASFITLEGAIHSPWEGNNDIVPVMVPFLAPGGDRSAPVAVPTEAAANSNRYDRDNRELVVDGETHSLTPLEHGFLAYLVDHADRVVTRDDALRDVWDQPFGGSNVVDAVVRTLRRKLGPYAPAVETVKGHGYRYRSGVIGD